MDKKRVIMIGEKESFIVKVMMKKIQEAGIECSFVRWEVNEINAAWKDDVALMTVYMGEHEYPRDDVLRFLADKLTDIGDRMILIGEQAELDHVTDRVPGELIYRSLKRPVSNEEYVRCVSELLNKKDSGEFKKSILIVDDDVSYLNIVREWLKDTYKVSMANSGLQAIKWLGKNKADLILLDYEMPEIDGQELMRRLRGNPETRLIPMACHWLSGAFSICRARAKSKPDGSLTS